MKLKMILSLTIVCLVSALLLSKVFQVTEPKIEADKAKNLKHHLMEVTFPMAAEYTVFDKDTSFEAAYDSAGNYMGCAAFTVIMPDTVWAVCDTLEQQIGIVFKVWPQGYGGPIETLVGLARDTTVTGIRPATPAEGLKETPGLGVKINEDWFRWQFVGKTESDVLLKKDGGTLDAITAATISARAVANGVRDGICKYKKYLVCQATEPSSDQEIEPSGD